MNWGRAIGGRLCLFTRLCCSPLDTLRPVKMLAAPALCEAKPDEVVTERRRDAVAIGRAHDGGGRVVPRPATEDAGEGVRRCFGAAHGVPPFKTWRHPFCVRRNPMSKIRTIGVRTPRNAARKLMEVVLFPDPPRYTRRRLSVGVLVRLTAAPSRASDSPAARSETRSCCNGTSACGRCESPRARRWRTCCTTTRRGRCRVGCP